MYPCRLIIAMLLAVGSAALCFAQEQEDEAPLGAETAESLKLRIDIDLIDLDDLYEAVGQPWSTEASPLTLEECVRRALEANPDLLVTSYEPLKADGDVMTAKGEFDPVLSSQATYSRASQAANPEAITYGGLTTIEAFRTTTQTSLGGKLPWGTEYAATLTLGKEETTYNAFREEWSGGLTFSLTQPLFRGRGKSSNLARLRIARNTRTASEDQVRLAALNTAAEVVKAYWDLVGAIESVHVREESLANAERLLEISQKRLDIGAAAAIEVLQAKAGVATRQSDLISARSAVADAEDVLKQLLDLREGEAFSAQGIAPVDRPEIVEADLDEGASTELALQVRPEIHAAQMDVESADVEVKRAAGDLMPQLDFTASVTQGGRSHKVRDVFDSIGQADEAFTGIFKGLKEENDTSYTLGVVGAVPLGNRAARGAYHRALMALRQARQQLEKVKQEARLRVRMATRGVRTSRVLVASNRQTSNLQQANVAAEEKRLRLGVTTSYRVLEVQEDLTAAQTAEVQARVNLRKALADLSLAEGSLLTGLGFDFEPPAPEPTVGFVRSVIPINVRYGNPCDGD